MPVFCWTRFLYPSLLYVESINVTLRNFLTLSILLFEVPTFSVPKQSFSTGLYSQLAYYDPLNPIHLYAFRADTNLPTPV